MSSKNNQSENNIEVIKRPTNEYVLMVDHKVIDWGESEDNGSLVVLGSNFIRLEYKGEVIAESKGVYFEIISSLKEQGSLIKVILMPDGDTYPVLNISRVISEEEYDSFMKENSVEESDVKEDSSSEVNLEDKSLVERVEVVLKKLSESEEAEAEAEAEKAVSELEEKLKDVDVYDQMLEDINKASDSISSIYSELILKSVDEKSAKEIFEKLGITFDSISRLRSQVFDLKFTKEETEDN